MEYGEKIDLLETHCCLETVRTGGVGILQSGCVWWSVGFWWASLVSGTSNVFRNERIAGRELGRGGYSRFLGGWSSDLSAAAGRAGQVFSPAGWAHSTPGHLGLRHGDGQLRARGPEFHICGHWNCPLQLPVCLDSSNRLGQSSYQPLFPTHLVSSVARSRELQESQYDQSGAVWHTNPWAPCGSQPGGPSWTTSLPARWEMTPATLAWVGESGAVWRGFWGQAVTGPPLLTVTALLLQFPLMPWPTSCLVLPNLPPSPALYQPLSQSRQTTAMPGPPAHPGHRSSKIQARHRGFIQWWRKVEHWMLRWGVDAKPLSLGLTWLPSRALLLSLVMS